MGAWRIQRGRYGNVSLDGLGFAFAAHWPQALHQGNGTACLFFDERANPQQREALLQITSGKAGGLPFEIVATTFSKILEPRYVPFEFHFNGRDSRVQIGDLLVTALESIKNPVTGDPEHLRVEHATGFMFKSAEVVAAKVNQCLVDGLKFSWPGKAAFVTQVNYSN